ncbi:Ig-like domain-containing protein [Myxococcota bacterium]
MRALLLHCAPWLLAIWGASVIGGCEPGRVTTSVPADLPKAHDDAGATQEDTAMRVDVLANDASHEDDELFVAAVAQAGHGRVAIDEASVIYTPELDYSGEDSFAYTARGRLGRESSAVVTMTITSVNDPPFAIMPAAVVTDEDTAAPVVSLTGADVEDPESALAVAVVAAYSM